MGETYIHESSYVDENVKIGKNTKIWHFSHIQRGAEIGASCSIGQNVNVANDVKIGNNVKIQNNVSVYSGVTIEDGVFLGPSCVFTNVQTPRSMYPVDCSQYGKTVVKRGASIGANATIVCGHDIGRYALIGAGAVVTQSVKNHALMVGVPARQIGWVCKCGNKLDRDFFCERCSCKYCETEDGLVLEGESI